MVRAVRKSGPDHALHGDEALSVLWEASVRWIAWGFHVVDGEKQMYQLGILDCKGHALVALVKARRRYGHQAVDHIQSVLSHEIDLLEKEKLAFDRHHPRRKKEKKKPLDDGDTLSNIMSSGNTYQQVAS